MKLSLLSSNQENTTLHLYKMMSSLLYGHFTAALTDSNINSPARQLMVAANGKKKMNSVPAKNM
jgi:hypothetical protein